MKGAKKVKILTWLQFCAVIGIVLSAWFYIRPQHAASAASRGLIDGILFSRDEPSVLIDGQVLKEGDEIYGTQVVEISRRIVTFEKNGRQWEQRVQQRPHEAWDKSEKSASKSTGPSI